MPHNNVRLKLHLLKQSFENLGSLVGEFDVGPVNSKR